LEIPLNKKTPKNVPDTEAIIYITKYLYSVSLLKIRLRIKGFPKHKKEFLGI
jgi:hypothetical protein